MCRALVVLCVAPDDDALAALKRATVSAWWELAPGAVTAQAAMDQLEDRRPDVLVVQGWWPDLVEQARRAVPWLRVVAVDDGVPADATASLEDVREAILGLPPPSGPVRT